MRLHFWRRKPVELGIAAGPVRWNDPEWCDTTMPKPVWQSEYHAPERELRVFDDLRIRLFADMADVGMEIYSSLNGRMYARAWELSQFPVDCSTLRGDLRTAVVRCGCDEARAEQLAGHTVSELTRLAADATIHRDHRLAALPAPADLRWAVHRSSHVRGRGASWTTGIYGAGDQRIRVRLECDIGAVSRAQISAVLESTQGTRVDRQEVAVPVDGLCCDAAAESLELWGWPTTVARSVGRAIAVRGRAEWQAGMLARDEANVIFHGDVPTRACVTTGCFGTMFLHDPLDAPPGPTHWEFPQCATWVCALNPAHTELVPLGHWSEIRRDQRRRQS